jgi:hypothetical protein
MLTSIGATGAFGSGFAKTGMAVHQQFDLNSVGRFGSATVGETVYPGTPLQL